MSDFLYLFRGGQPSPDLSPEELQQHMARWGAWIGALAEQGKFKSGAPLTSEGHVVEDSGRVVSDGPYAEAKDVVGGYLVVSAETMAEAVELSKACPIFASGGNVEVRGITAM